MYDGGTAEWRWAAAQRAQPTLLLRIPPPPYYKHDTGAGPISLTATLAARPRSHMTMIDARLFFVLFPLATLDAAAASLEVFMADGICLNEDS